MNVEYNFFHYWCNKVYIELAFWLKYVQGVKNEKKIKNVDSCFFSVLSASTHLNIAKVWGVLKNSGSFLHDK